MTPPKKIKLLPWKNKKSQIFEENDGHPDALS